MHRFPSRSLKWLGHTIAIASTALVVTLTPSTARGAIANTPTADSRATTETTAVSQLFETPQFCSGDLSRTINTIIRQPQFDTATWGIFMDKVAASDPVYAYNADDLLIPASNIKLLTTAAAMQIIAERDPDRVWAFRDELNMINRDSNNAQADTLLRNIGGQTQVQAVLAPLGIEPDDFVQADGSGLSRRNQVKPLALVTLLKGMYATDDSGLYYDSLPIAGVNGTLRHRFQGSPVQGKVHAKTGTLSGVRALSGYVDTAGAGTIAFSIVVNQPGQSGQVMLDAIDTIVINLSQLEDCD
jgi:D-alanyl-D-alanine carboxypeptidase/D-alanyl-D-alanine-endopeptidase (penicillin-binding protein 4)